MNGRRRRGLALTLLVFCGVALGEALVQQVFGAQVEVAAAWSRERLGLNRDLEHSIWPVVAALVPDVFVGLVVGLFFFGSWLVREPGNEDASRWRWAAPWMVATLLSVLLDRLVPGSLVVRAGVAATAFGCYIWATRTAVRWALDYRAREDLEQLRRDRP